MNVPLSNNCKFLVILAFVIIFFPSVSLAAVSISEVAWMGSAASANYEWIELHNDAEASDVTGWILSDGMNFSVELTGMIPAESYVVLERTSDASAAGDAFFIYTGALVNSGATLKLARADGSIVDQVSGGENWVSIGGDNVTKETAQYTSAGWVTAVATPGRGITASEVSVATTTETKIITKSASISDLSTQKVKASEPVRLIIPDVTLKLKVVAQTVGYVNQEISFTVKATDIGDTLIDSLAYEWNFGDGFTSVQKEAKHVFMYPGTYVVTVYGGFKRQEQVARHEITILPVTVSLTTNNRGDIQINNDSPYEIDISGYQVRGAKTFTFPSRSVMLPNQTVTIPKIKLGNNTNFAVLYDKTQSLVTSLVSTKDSLLLADSVESEESLLTSDIKTLSRKTFPLVTASENFSFIKPNSALASEPEIVPNDNSSLLEMASSSVSSSTELTDSEAATKTKNKQWTYLALVGVLLLGTLAVYANPKRNQNS